MPLLTSTFRLGLFGALLTTSGCHHHRHRDEPKDSSLDPVGAADGGVCTALDGSCRPGASDIVVTGAFNNCPTKGAFVTPLQVFLDQPVMVISSAVDPDADLLTYEWTAEPDGHFDKLTAPATFYRCDSIGRKTLLLTVDDGRGCSIDEEVEVSCVNVSDFITSGTQQVPTAP